MKSAAVSDRRLELFVFIRVQLWLECAKQILWKLLVDAFAAGPAYGCVSRWLPTKSKK